MIKYYKNGLNYYMVNPDAGYIKVINTISFSSIHVGELIMDHQPEKDQEITVFEFSEQFIEANNRLNETSSNFVNS